MTSEPKRVFSGAKITITDRRCALGDVVVNALECLKSWEREGLTPALNGDVIELDRVLNAIE